jgi:hypothetical protein
MDSAPIRSRQRTRIDMRFRQPAYGALHEPGRRWRLGYAYRQLDGEYAFEQ